MSSKHILLYKEIIFKYHPLFKTGRKYREAALSDPKLFNVERLVEQSFAEIGPYNFIDAAHADFSDGSDSKTASIRSNPVKMGLNTHVGEIANVSTAGGGQKIGSLRCVIYNPHQEELLYYFLPKTKWSNHITIHPSSGIGKVVFSYNRNKNYIPMFQGYKCKSFEDLALM